MARVAYRIVDVFTDRPLTGNALCVVDGDPGGTAVMQAVAREMNLSETTFVTARHGTSYDVRIFTPGAELPFAGHPTLGTAWTLGPGRWTQRSPGAEVEIEVTETTATMSQPDPTFVEVYPADAARAWGLPEARVPRAFIGEVGGTKHLLLPTDAPLHDLSYDTSLLLVAARGLGLTGIVPMRKVDDSTVHLRAAIVAGGVVFEDPGTGSAAGPAAVLARDLWSVDTEVVLHQGDEVNRPCRMTVHAQRGSVRVGGDVTPVAEGTIRPLG